MINSPIYCFKFMLCMFYFALSILHELTFIFVSSGWHINVNFMYF